MKGRFFIITLPVDIQLVIYTEYAATFNIELFRPTE